MNIFQIQLDSSVIYKVRVVLTLTLLAFLLNMTFPQAVQAQETFSVLPQDDVLVLKNDVPVDLLTSRFINSPTKADLVKDEVQVARTMRVTATAYSSTPDQTDSTPCLTANGFNVCKHGKEEVIAANFLKFGTKVRMPDLYGDKIFTVQDRMNPRYNARIDFWKTSRASAKQFGVKHVTIEILQ